MIPLDVPFVPVLVAVEAVPKVVVIPVLEYACAVTVFPDVITLIAAA